MLLGKEEVSAHNPVVEDVEDIEDNMSDGANSLTTPIVKVGKSDEQDVVIEAHEVAEDFPLREVSLFGTIHFNPVVSFVGAGMLWALALYCGFADGALETMDEGQVWIRETFTWLYISSQNVWLIFYVYIVYKHGHVKLGADDEKPEFSNLEYFAMLFCAGIGGGIFYFGSAEPIYHYTEENRVQHWTEDERAREAMNITLFHWGLHGWIVYSVIASLLGFVSYRKGLPLTMRSCFYPLLGDYTWGWIGDFFDGLTIITCVAGVCTSLGLSARQLSQGLEIVGFLDPAGTEDELNNRSIVLIWIITVCATVSLVSGLNVGIKYLSKLAFYLGMFLCTCVFVMDKTWYILNGQVQLIGYYFQYILQLGWFTDAFSQLKAGEGRAIDASSTAYPEWQDYWTIFYWGWWIAWAPFVGLFLARISRGRTIFEVFMYTLSIPLAYAVMWMGIVGGSSLRMFRRAKELIAMGETVFEDADYFMVSNETTGSCYAIDDEEVAFKFNDLDVTFDQDISPVCDHIDETTWFRLLRQYGSLGDVLCYISLVTILIYFVTSSDSGSLVVDTIASNGREKQHPIQRILWACTEGGVAHALLGLGGEGGLKALRAASIITGLPYTIFFCIMMLAFWRALEFDAEQYTQVTEDTKHHIHLKKWSVFSSRQFKMPVYGGLFDYIDVLLSFGKLHPGRGAVYPTGEVFTKTLVGIFLPFYGAGKVLLEHKNTNESRFQVFLMAALFIASAFFMLVGFAFEHNVQMLGVVFYIAFSFILGQVRHTVREVYSIPGNIFEDVSCAFCMYPQVVAQLLMGPQDVDEKEENVSSELYTQA